MLINNLLYIQGNIVSIIILFLLYFSKSASGKRANDQKHYNSLILSTIAVSIADTGMWLINDLTFSGARYVNIIISTVCYSLTPVVGLYCVIYIFYKINGSEGKRKVKSLLPFYIIFLICIVLLIINLIPGCGFLFTVSAANHYSRGPFFWLFTVIPFIYMFHGCMVSILASLKEKNLVLRREYLYMSMFILPPLVGATIQTFTGYSFTWSFVTISLLFLYIKFQNHQVSVDMLTGVNNRRELENYLSWQIGLSNTTGMYVLMLDIDEFKMINDRFGHVVGDEALMRVAKLLTGISNKDDFIARYGGDEFIIVCHRDSPRKAEALITAIEKSISDFNKEKRVPFHLSVSIGYSHYRHDEKESIDTFISRADKRMYEIKVEKKLAREQMKNNN